MAKRPVRTSRSSKIAPKHKMTQVEINRVKPAGVLSLAILEQDAQNITSINVKLPDSEIYKFFHLPMTVDDAEELFRLTTEQSRVAGLRQLLSRLLVNEDGSVFATSEQLGSISIKVMNTIFEAMSSSAKDEPGED